jgi:HEAT repeat protein
MFSRASWEAAAFDERTFELEDHYWTKCQLDGTNCVRFVPDALVYHYTHLSRNDRVFPPLIQQSDAGRLDRAISNLNNSETDWPETMMAALTIKSMKSEPHAMRAIPALTRHLAEHWDFDVRWRMAGALGKLADWNAVESLITALSDPSFYARDEAAWALAELGRFAAPQLLARLSTVPRREWPLAAIALGRSGHLDAERKAVELIDQGLRDTQGSLRRNYLYAAGEIEVARDLTLLASHVNTFLEAEDDHLRAVAAWAAGSLSRALGEQIDWTRVRARAAADPAARVRVEAVAALGKALARSPDSASVSSLTDATNDPDALVRYAALQAARLLAEGDGISVTVKEGTEDVDNGVRFENELLNLALARAQPQRKREHAI